jgi:2-octaprenylphenol hydroxylase
MSVHYDVIIVGAGMVGSTLAAALGRQQTIKIALIEPFALKPISSNDHADLRVSAISQASENLLKNLNIWPHLISERLSPFTDMKVWETESSTIHFDSADIGEPHLGHLIENRHIQQASLIQCKQYSNIDFICPDKPISKDGDSLILESGRQLSADLIVAADGAQSPLREWVGIPTKGWDYEQQGIVCTVTTELPHAQTARQRFLPGGPLAFLPLANPHQCSIVWSNSTAEAQLLNQLNDEDFRQTLATAFDYKLGNIIDVSQRASFPLKLRHADHYIKLGFALVGDAAHTIHPLAGQGVNIGFLDAATLAEIIIETHKKGRNIGSDNPTLKLARQCGFSAVNNNSLLKRLFMHQASGQRFANPNLSKLKI